MVQAIKNTGLILLCILVWTGCKKEKMVVGYGRSSASPDTFKNMMLLRFTLLSYTFTDTKGNKWDKSDGPDIFFVLKNREKTLLTSEVAYNVPYTTLSSINDTVPAVWRFTTPLTFENYMQNDTSYWIYFYDKDDTGDQFMFSASLLLSDLKEPPELVFFDFDEEVWHQSAAQVHIDTKLY